MQYSRPYFGRPFRSLDGLCQSGRTSHAALHHCNASGAEKEVRRKECGATAVSDWRSRSRINVPLTFVSKALCPRSQAKEVCASEVHHSITLRQTKSLQLLQKTKERVSAVTFVLTPFFLFLRNTLFLYAYRARNVRYVHYAHMHTAFG